MKNLNIEFEHFITERFLEFYNNRESTNFAIKEKIDEKEREKSIYDFHCVDKNSKKEMAIEVKRLIPKEKTHIQNIRNWIHNYVEEPLKGKINGEYFLLIKGFESPFRSDRKERIKLLRNIREEIQSLEAPGEYYKLKCCDAISLLRFSKEDSDITAWPVDANSGPFRSLIPIYSGH